MERVRAGDGHLVVVPRVTCRRPTGPTQLPLSVLFAQDVAVGTLDGFGERELLPRVIETGVRDDPEREPPAVSMDAATDSGADPLDREPASGDPIDWDRSSFVLGLHASTVGDGDPTSPQSLVGARELPTGTYRDVPVPIWTENPFPIAAPERPGERPRTDWTTIDLAADRQEGVRVEVTATLWPGLAVEAGGGPGPIRDDAGRPVTATWTRLFGDERAESDREVVR